MQLDIKMVFVQNQYATSLLSKSALASLQAGIQPLMRYHHQQRPIIIENQRRTNKEELLFWAELLMFRPPALRIRPIWPINGNSIHRPTSGCIEIHTNWLR